MRKSKVEQLRESKKTSHKLTEMSSLDDLLKLLIDGDNDVHLRRLNPTQRAFIYDGARLKAYKGPAGCAKTSTGCGAIFARALLEPGTKYLIARHDYNDLMDTTAARMTEMLGRLPKGTLLDRDKSPPMKWYIQPAAVRDANGDINDEPSQFTFMGLKESLGSYEFNGAFVDEADEVEEKRIHEINTRLRHKGGNYSISLAFNPPDVNHWLYTACTGMDGQNNFIKQPWLKLFEPKPDENVNNLPTNYYELLTESLPEDMRMRLVEGKWGSTFPGQPVYRQFKRSLHVDDAAEFKPSGTLFRFWDFGYGHPACIWAQASNLGRIIVLREYLGKEVEATEFARQVKFLTAQHFPYADRIMDYGDIAVKQKKDTGQTLAALIKEGVTIHYQSMGIDESVRKVRSLFEKLIDGKPAIQIHKRCQILIGAMSGGYHLKDDGTTPHKDGFYDHLADALRYGIVNVLGNGFTINVQIPTSIAYRPEADSFRNWMDPNDPRKLR